MSAQPVPPEGSLPGVHHDLTTHSTALRGLALLLEQWADAEDADNAGPFLLDYVVALLGLCAREAERLADGTAELLAEFPRTRQRARTATGASR